MRFRNQLIYAFNNDKNPIIPTDKYYFHAACINNYVLKTIENLCKFHTYPKFNHLSNDYANCSIENEIEI